MRVPGIIDLLGLFQPVQDVVGAADDVKSAVATQVRVLEIETIRLCPIDADSVFYEAQRTVADIFEKDQPLFAPTGGDDVQIAITVEIDGL